MYIRVLPRARDDILGELPAEEAEWGLYRHHPADQAGDPPPSVFPGLSSVFRPLAESLSGLGLRKRDGLQDQNVTIGVVIGVALALFIIGACFFLYRYRFSVRFTHKKKHRHRSGSSKSSKTSTSSASSDAAAPAG